MVAIMDSYENNTTGKNTTFSQMDTNILRGDLKIVQHDKININNKFDILYIPNEEERKIRENIQKEYLMLSFDSSSDIIIIYPLRTIRDEDFLSARYDDFKEITFKGFCNILYEEYTKEDCEDITTLFTTFPRGFIKTLRYGLGLVRDYSFLINVINENDDSIKSLCICQDATHKTEDCLYINIDSFDRIIKHIDSIIRNTQSISRNMKWVDVYNFLSDITKKDKRKYLTPKTDVGKLFYNFIHEEDKYDLSNRNPLVKSFVQKHPDTAEDIKKDIELTKFELFKDEFKKKLEGNHNENIWQKFFNKNFNILSFITGCPTIKIREQASVGGKKIDGTSEKIADFLVKNRINNNVALIEIKKPSTKIIKESSYRNNVYNVSDEIIGGITQVLDQKYQLNKHALLIKENSKIDFETYNINCFLVAGKMPAGEEQKKSFELFRSNLKDVKIVTFDELYNFISDLYLFLNQKN